MIFNLIIGAFAGYLARYAEAPLGSVLKGKYAMEKPDLRVLTFITLLLAASILIGLAGADGKPFVLLIGGAIGIFFNYIRTHGTEQYNIQKTKMDERSASAGGSQPVEPRVSPAKSETPAKKTAQKKPTAKKAATKKPASKSE